MSAYLLLLVSRAWRSTFVILCMRRVLKNAATNSHLKVVLFIYVGVLVVARV
jgi:hypothetical protein